MQIRNSGSFLPQLVCQICVNEIRRQFPDRGTCVLRNTPLFFSLVLICVPTANLEVSVITYHLVATMTRARMMSLPPVSKRGDHGGKIGSHGALGQGSRRTTVTVRTSSRPSPAETPSRRVELIIIIISALTLRLLTKYLPIRFCAARHRFQVTSNGINVSFSRSGIARGCLRFHTKLPPRRCGLPRVYLTGMMDAIAHESRPVF